MPTRLRQYDYGTLIKVATGDDVSTTDEQRIIYRRPDGLSGSWVASVDAEDGEAINYTIQAGDIDVSGEWQFQSWIKSQDGQWYGRVTKTIVEPIIKQVAL